MITILGNTALIIASIISVLSASCACFARLHSRYAIYLSLVQSGVILGSFALLIYGFVTSDFSLSLVFQHSSSLIPTIYKISGSWGNHEGSILLWLTELSLVTSLFAIFAKYEAGDKAKILLVQHILIFIFLLFIILVSNPFDSLKYEMPQGLGLNPILQDIGLAIHPPILYMGYVGLSLIFSASVIALIKGANLKEWLPHLRVWLLLSWSFLTAGVTLGSWWAYRELGWGGFWFWDPVENIALMPWLATNALIHLLITTVKRGIYQRWFIFLSFCTFILSLFGSFLVRSGLLTSVHSFASDPTRGLFMLSIIFAIAIVSLGLFIKYGGQFKSQTTHALISRETGMLLNNLLLVSFLIIILVAIFYPIYYNFAYDKFISIGAPYFNSSLVPIVVPFILLTGIGVVFEWQQARAKAHSKKFLLYALVAGIATYLLRIKSLSLFAGIFLLVLMMALLIRRIKLKNFSPGFCRMFLGHTGFAILVIAIAINAAWQSEVTTPMRMNEKIHFAGYDITLRDIQHNQHRNYFARHAILYVEQNGNEITTLTPETRLYPVERTTTADSSIFSHPFADLYSVLGEFDEKQQLLTVRLYYRPMMKFIWLAAIMMSLSGLYYVRV
jgi:cytochrome c-type biogenesis protein CcmF